MSEDLRDKAFKDYEAGMKYKDIAEKHGVSLSAVKSWASRYWKQKGCNPATKKVATKKKGAPTGNRNAAGHGGTGPPGNKNAERHGFYAKWLPPETMEIIQCIERSNPIDLLWDNIQLQYAAIIRAQNLMFVRDQEDTTTTKIAESSGDSSYSEKWEVQQAWDKHANFLQAQSRAMKTLESMIKQYDELTRSGMVSEEQRARIDKLKADISKINGEGEEIEDLTETDDLIYGDK
ncbi:phage terminase small subunit [Acetobacterium wieringae]|uniref:phage terminase small subunit n=1 Tax=Acetobacterium wieringae TaxID=52694 RepID=UPI002034136B|nr:phage terminase small subunit [Acetobacterium wieringae]URN85160.1 phage terminase small subunit [Acetobacterium wieringae]